MTSEIRRSLAQQENMETDVEPKPEEKKSTYDKVVELLNDASLMQKDSLKINHLKQVQELIVHKESNLLDNFLDEMIAFQTDRSIDVRKFVVGFMEEACKKEPELLLKVLPNLTLNLQSENVNVQKKVILVMPTIYRVALQWVSKAKTASSEMTMVWDQISGMKAVIFELLDSENDGVRTHVAKFLEGVVLILTAKSKESEIPKKQENDYNISGIQSDGNPYFKLKKLEDEGKLAMDAMLHFQASAHISSINLMTVMGGLTNIAKQRPIYFGRVVHAFEALNVNLPPTLAKSQVSSVRKQLKMQMIGLLKHSIAVEYVSSITTLLTDLGASQSEINKFAPKVDESKKRKATESAAKSKKQKLDLPVDVDVDADADDDDDDVSMTPWTQREEKKTYTESQRQTAIDITSEDILPKLTAQNVADLVLISMVMLPETAPAQFQSTYTPIDSAGTNSQIKHLARLLAAQLTSAGMGKGVLAVLKKADAEVTEDDPEATAVPPSPKQLIQTLVGGKTLKDLARPEMPPPVLLPPSSAPRKGIKQFKLSSVTNALSPDDLQEMSICTFKRILYAGNAVTSGVAAKSRIKILTSLVCQFGGELKEMLQDYIFEDLRNRCDIAFSWLYQEYANCRGFSAATLSVEHSTLASYDECLTRLLAGLLDRPDHKEGLFTRLILESPIVTDNAMQVLKKYCMDENRVTTGMYTLRDLILSRPAHRLRYLDVLLEFVSIDRPEIRSAAIRTVKKLYERQSLKEAIETYASTTLKNLLLPNPTSELFTSVYTKAEIPDTWTEETIKMCLYLYLGLLPSNHQLIHELALVYTATAADIKRIILRVLETPVKGMGMESPELLLLVENCPKGAETLVTRIIHILTDKAAPSPELVERVRDLYDKRVPDVRFLIPVLTGLEKDEVIAALPKLLKLNPIVVKEVFNRLLGGHGDGGATYISPLTPAELLIALHNIDPNKCDMKTVIKATNLCFGEKNVYTQEVLAVVMQNLMEHNPLPTLFMRTVLQSLSMCPRLIGFIMNILQRLIIKQVWKQKKVWEGFIRCCQRTKPQSFQVLLQLPASQLKSVFQLCPELREPLLNHVNSFTQHQQAHIPKAIIEVLQRDPEVEKRVEEIKASESAKLTGIPVQEGEPMPPGFDMPVPVMSTPNPVKVLTSGDDVAMMDQTNLEPMDMGRSPIISTLEVISTPEVITTIGIADANTSLGDMSIKPNNISLTTPSQSDEVTSQNGVEPGEVSHIETRESRESRKPRDESPDEKTPRRKERSKKSSRSSRTPSPKKSSSRKKESSSTTTKSSSSSSRRSTRSKKT